MRMDTIVSSPADLQRRFVFLSASFPYGRRADRFTPSHPGDIADAVVAVARGVLNSNGRLVFGGHPTISPLVLMVASENRSMELQSVVIYQSRLFEASVTAETLELEKLGQGEIRWVDVVSGESIDQGLEDLVSLENMRQRMLLETQPVAGFFVGGMEGILEESAMLTRLIPEAPILPIGRPGGAASELQVGAEIPGRLASFLSESNLYPSIVATMLSHLTEELG